MGHILSQREIVYIRNYLFLHCIVIKYQAVFSNIIFNILLVKILHYCLLILLIQKSNILYNIITLFIVYILYMRVCVPLGALSAICAYRRRRFVPYSLHLLFAEVICLIISLILANR